MTIEERVGNYRVDMVARKDDVVIFFEVKTGDVRAETKTRIKQQASYLKEAYPGSKFLLIAVRYPDEDTIVIDNIEELLYDYLVSKGIPSDLDELSTHTTIASFLLTEALSRWKTASKRRWTRVSGEYVSPTIATTSSPR